MGAALLAAGAADTQPRGCEWAGGIEGWCMVGGSMRLELVMFVLHACAMGGLETLFWGVCIAPGTLSEGDPSLRGTPAVPPPSNCVIAWMPKGRERCLCTGY